MRFPRVRILEFLPLGHGPLWLDYYGSSAACVCRELTVRYPDLPAYAALESASKAWASHGGAKVRLEPYRFRPGWGCLDDRQILESACEPGADLCLITYFDGLMSRYPDGRPRQLDVSGSLASGRPALWGTWFSPVSADRTFGLRFNLQARREHATFLRAQAAPPSWLDGAFFLDAELARRVSLSGEKRVLPDPWPTRPRQDQTAAREALGLPREATIFLHFGVSSPRKGLDDVLRAWPKTPRPALLLRAGAVDAGQRTRLGALERDGRAVLHDRYVPDAEVDTYFRAADWILLPYRWYDGSSGVLSGAAAAQRPVIAAEYGVIGRRVRTERLGELHAPASARSLRAAVVRALARPIATYAEALDRHAAAHSVVVLREAIRSAWSSDPARSPTLGADDLTPATGDTAR